MTLLPDSERPETSPNPAANAIRHGFCASKFLSPETLARAETIRAELTEIHEPWSREETEAVAQFAFARAQQFDMERAMFLKVADEKARATAISERIAVDRFQADLARFRDDPASFGPLLGMSFHGALWLTNLWARVRTELAPDSAGHPGCLPFALACDAAAALGSPWQVDRAEPEAARFLALTVRIAPDPDVALVHWIDRSATPDGPAFARARAARILAQTPADPAMAAAELTTTAAREYDLWSLRANVLRADYETARDAAADAAVGTGSGDPALEKEFRLLSRYLTAARNRADRLQRRLDHLKKDRKSMAARAQRDAEREARRLRKESEKALSRFEIESARSEREHASFHAESNDPAYGINEQESCSRELFACGLDRAFETRQSIPAAADPCSVPDRSDRSQNMAFHKDTGELRNGSPDSDDEADADEDDMGEVAGPDRSPKPILGRDAPFKDRVRAIRYRDWSDPAAVVEDEADLLRQFVELPVSFERDLTIRAFFGSEAVLRRCWQAYRSWAGPDRPGDGSANRSIDLA